MSPQEAVTRIPLQVGSQLRTRADGEVSVSNPTVEAAPAQDAADAIVDYRFDRATGERVLRLVQPVAAKRNRRK